MNNADFRRFCAVSQRFSPISAIWGLPMILVANLVEKMIKICQIFFSKKSNLKAIRKPSLIKNGRTEPIFTHIYDMAPGALPLGVGTTIENYQIFANIIEGHQTRP